MRYSQGMTTPLDRLTTLLRKHENPPSGADLARMAKIPASTMRSYLNGTRALTMEACFRIAEPLGVRGDWLYTGKGALYPADEQPAPAVTTLPLIGEVAANNWADPADRYSDGFSEPDLPVPADPRFSREDQFLLRIKGPSVNRRAPSGSLARCVRFGAARQPRAGDWVVAERTRANGEVETTIKRLKAAPNGQWELWPDSDDPRHQMPLSLGRHGDETTIISAYVLDFIIPATQM